MQDRDSSAFAAVELFLHNTAQSSVLTLAPLNLAGRGREIN